MCEIPFENPIFGKCRWRKLSHYVLLGDYLEPGVSEGRPRCQVSYSLPLQCFTMLAANFAWICIETDAQIEQNMNMKHQFGSILQTAALVQARIATRQNHNRTWLIRKVVSISVTSCVPDIRHRHNTTYLHKTAPNNIYQYLNMHSYISTHSVVLRIQGTWMLTSLCHA